MPPQFENKEIFSLCVLYIEEGAEWICCAKIMAKVVLRTAQIKGLVWLQENRQRLFMDFSALQK